MSVSRDYSDEKLKVIDEEISLFIRNAEKFADKILKENIQQLHALANTLLDYETITGKEMETILNGEEIIRDKIIQDESLENVRKLDDDKIKNVKPITANI